MAEITLKELSRLTGLSIRSVSRALQGKSGLRAENRSKVLAAAERLGYTPNIQARNLRLHKNNFIGIVAPNFDDSGRGYISARKMNRLQQALEQHGYFTLVGVATEKRDDMENLLKQWRGLVSAIVFFAWNRDLRPKELLAGFSLPVIFADIATDYGHSMQIDRSSGIYDAMRFLAESGHHHLARCGNISSREAGFNNALRDTKALHIRHKHFAVNSDFEDGYQIAPELIRGHFDGVFFDTDRMAFGFLKYCRQHDIQIPEDIAVVGFDDDPWDIYSCPSLSTVAHPVSEMVEAIMELLEHPRKEFCHFNFKTRFIRRESV